MAVVFRCSSCGLEHPSRVWGPNRQWVEIYLEVCGEVLERCPGTGDWVRLAPSTTSWVPSHLDGRIAAPPTRRSAAIRAEPPTFSA